MGRLRFRSPSTGYDKAVDKAFEAIHTIDEPITHEKVASFVQDGDSLPGIAATLAISNVISIASTRGQIEPLIVGIDEVPAYRRVG